MYLGGLQNVTLDYLNMQPDPFHMRLLLVTVAVG